MKKIITLACIASITLLSWCTQPTNDTWTENLQACSLTQTGWNACTGENTESNVLAPDVSAATHENVGPLETTKAILQSLKDKDIQTLVTYINTGTKVRFSPYSYVNTETDIMLNGQELINKYQDTNNVLTRWTYDGSGEPININVKDYFQKFIYDMDFLNAPEINENHEIMRGNSINNVFDIYANDYIVEFYIPGIDPQYDGMDRKSLTLVVKNTNGKRYLIGIIHNQRTI